MSYSTHDIVNPADDPEFRQPLVQLVPPEIARIAGLAQKLGDLAPDSAPNRSVALRTVLERVVALFREQARECGVEIGLEIEPRLPAVPGNEDRLIQLFTNLLQNAVEATARGGHVWIHAASNGSSVRVQVIDEGTGIDPKIRDRMFEPFVTTKQSGMGLGLAICREIVEAHHGRLTIENRPGRPGTLAEIHFRAIENS